jgi:hypothetical protein
MNTPTRRRQNGEGGFQLKDLVCVLAIITLLGSVQLASLADNRVSTMSDVCRNNLRRLTQAWLMYSDDNAGKLVPNNGSSPDYPVGTWVAGWLDFSAAFDNLNTDYLIASERTGKYGLLGPYLQRDASAFRCPADASSITVFGIRHNRVRSYSMNNWMGGIAHCGQEQFYYVNQRQAEISRPAERWVLAEELPASINDSLLLVRMHEEYIVDYPGNAHSGGTWTAFTDGHLEFRRWIDPRTHPTYNGDELIPLNVPSPGNPDMAWLRERTTDKKPGAPL